MRSSRRRPEDGPSVFFLDRGLGKRHVAGMLERAGQPYLLMSDVYANDGQDVGDVVWIERASEEGWIALTKDVAIVRDHLDALAASTLRVFALPNANLTGPEMAERFETNLHRILQRSRRPGPYVDVVRPGRLERRWPRPPVG